MNAECRLMKKKPKTGKLSGTFLAALIFVTAAGAEEAAWQRPMTVDARTVSMGGRLGEAFDKGLARIAKAPYMVDWLRADVSFETKRAYINYSGDVSGRFLELASLTTPPGRKEPATLEPVLATITGYQKPDGHYGQEVDWSQPVDFTLPVDQQKMLPIFWGNARLLVGLLAAAGEFKDQRLLDSAKRIGEFYLSTASRFGDTERMAEYHKTGGAAAGYVTCYFHGIEGLVLLSQATGDQRFLQQAEKMAAFFARFDKLPIDHAHGNLSSMVALLMLHEATGKEDYLKRVVAKWELAVSQGYISPIGGVGEAFYQGPGHDEGCALTDWLRMNLGLWRATGQTRYLDMAERLLWNQYLANQFENGGFGIRFTPCDAAGVQAVGKFHGECTWCCSFHGPLGLHLLKGHLAAGNGKEVFYNFPIDFTAPVTVKGRNWTLTSRTLTPHPGELVRCRIKVETDRGWFSRMPLKIRVPEWAEDVTVQGPDGRVVPVEIAGGYAKVSRPCSNGQELDVAFRGGAILEDRRCGRITVKPGETSRHKGAVIRLGPKVLFAGSTPALLLASDAAGRLPLSADAAGTCEVIPLEGDVTAPVDPASLWKSTRRIPLTPLKGNGADGETFFAFDVLVAPR